MDEKTLIAQLRSEGFKHTYVWQDGPNIEYPEHTHPKETAHIVLGGEMTLTMQGRTTKCKKGERCDVPSGAVHSARIGPNGCRYLIGER